MFQKDHSCTEWNGLEEIKTRGDTEGSRARRQRHRWRDDGVPSWAQQGVCTEEGALKKIQTENRQGLQTDQTGGHKTGTRDNTAWLPDLDK